MGENVNAKNQDTAAPDTNAQQGGVMQDVQDMIENSLKNAIEKMQKTDISNQMGGASDADNEEAAQAQMDIDEIKTIVSTLQKFIDNINMMIAQLEGGGDAYVQEDDKFLDDYMATADSILEMAAFSTKDNVTGISNRYGFDSRLILEWNRAVRQESSLSLIIFGVNGFNYEDESLDRKDRDDILRSMANVLSSSIKRSTDFIARWNDDEFAALLPITESAGSMIVAERIRDEIGKMAIPGLSNKGKITACVGLCVQTPGQDEALAVFIENTSKALSKSREAGQGQIVLG